MADRLTEKKESKSDDYRIPVVTPYWNRNAEEEEGKQQQQQQRGFNPRDYKANTTWTNPFSFLGQTEPPKTTTTTTTRTTTDNHRRRSKMTDYERTSDTTATVLKEEMRWNNKANKTPTILELLEFKADLIEGLRECTYRGKRTRSHIPHRNRRRTTR